VTEVVGERLREATDVQVFLVVEEQLGLSERFEEIDTLLDDAVAAALHGDRILDIAVRRQGPSLLKLTTVSRKQREWLNAGFSKPAHEAKGSWYLPETVRVNAGAFVLAEALLSQPRFAASVVTAQGAEASSGAGEAVFVWAALDPLFETLTALLLLRSRQAGATKPEQIVRAWASIDPVLEALGLDGEDAVAEFRSNADWAHASPELHVQRRTALGEAFRAHAAPGLGRWYRAHRLQMLIQRYYTKAKKERPTKAQVLRRSDERTLTALFAGDWIAFLDYLGEAPAEGEEMVTALPEPKLFVSGGRKAASVAAKVGVSSAEVERILGALFGSGEAVSPIKEREQALRRLWEALDDLHARQEPNMLAPSLYPLAEDWGDEVHGDEELGLEWETRRFLEDLRDATLASIESSAGSSAVRFPPDLVREVENLWDAETIARYPKAIVTNLHPWREAQRALGPAAFWQELIVRLWQNFEEDYDARSVGALGSYFRDGRRALADLGFPVDDGMFEKLIEVEQTLPPAQEVVRSEGPAHSVMGIELRLVMTSGRRRPGFTKMRDIVTAYRRAWAAQHLDAYLERVWQDELRAVAEAINRHHAEKRKSPTARQLAGMTADTANRWCGGRIGLLCAAIGEKDTLHQTYDPKVPPDRRLFVRRLFTVFGGKPVPKINYREDDEETQQAKRKAADCQRGIAVLTIGALRLLQLEEATGATPTLKQYGTADFQRYAERVWAGESVDELWSRYLAAVQEALRGDAEPAPLPPARISRPPVTLRDVEPEHESQRAPTVRATVSASKTEHRSLLGRLFGRGDPPHGQPLASAPPVGGSRAYALQSEGWSDVVGESHYQEALEATRASLRYDRELGREIFDALLVPEPDNEYDPKAIAVYSTGGKIGYVPRGSLWFEVLSRAADAGHPTASCRAWLIGGDEGKYLGAVLCADPDEELNLLLD
jgi:HIRAN domain